MTAECRVEGSTLEWSQDCEVWTQVFNDFSLQCALTTQLSNLSVHVQGPCIQCFPWPATRRICSLSETRETGAKEGLHSALQELESLYPGFAGRGSTRSSEVEFPTQTSQARKRHHNAQGGGADDSLGDCFCMSSMGAGAKQAVSSRHVLPRFSS